MTADDLGFLVGWLSHADDYELFDRDAQLPVTLQGLQEAWRETLDPSSITSRWFVLMHGADPIAIGGLQSISETHGDAVLPVFVARTARRRGVATALMASLLDIAFDRFALFRVTTYLRDDNRVSKRLTASVGFVEEGVLRQSWVAGGARHDTIVLGILGSEWKERRLNLMNLFQDIAIIAPPEISLRQLGS